MKTFQGMQQGNSITLTFHSVGLHFCVLGRLDAGKQFPAPHCNAISMHSWPGRCKNRPGIMRIGNGHRVLPAVAEVSGSL